MRYATLRGEKSVGELVNRLYQLPKGNKLSTAATQSSEEVKALIKTAEAALQRANPGLLALDKVPPGLVLIVPPVHGLNPAPGALPAGAAAQDAVAEIKQAILGDLKTLDSSAQSELIDLNAFLQGLKNDADWKPLQRINNFETVKTAARTEGEQRGKNLDTLRAMVKQIAKQLDNDLKNFGETMQ
jgi:hypothetical protein